MTPPRARLTAVILAAVALVAPRVEAAGGSEKEAQTFFVEGMKLMGKKRYAEACESFAKSQELDPGMGTQFRLAECYEKLGRLASAYEQFNAVADSAKEAKKPDRESVARKRAAALETRVAKLTISISPAVADLAGLDVRRDGKPVDRSLWGEPIPVDPGDHIVTVTAPKKKPWEGKVWAEGTSKLLVSVAALENVAPPPMKIVPRSIIPAVALGAAGGVGLVVGVTFVGLRASKASDAVALHDKIRANDGNCVAGGTGAFVTDCRALSSATGTGDSFGTVSVVSFILGGAAIGGMVTYLLLPEQKVPVEGPGAGDRAGASVYVSPVIGAGQGGFIAGGTF